MITKPLTDALTLIIDAIKDTIAVSDAPFSVLSLLQYKNLLGDIAQLAPELAQVPASVRELTPEDTTALLEEIGQLVGVETAEKVLALLVSAIEHIGRAGEAVAKLKDAIAK